MLRRHIIAVFACMLALLFLLFPYQAYGELYGQEIMYSLDVQQGRYYAVNTGGQSCRVFYVSGGSAVYISAYWWDADSNYIIFQAPITGRIYLRQESYTLSTLDTKSWFNPPSSSFPTVQVQIRAKAMSGSTTFHDWVSNTQSISSPQSYSPQSISWNFSQGCLTVSYLATYQTTHTITSTQAYPSISVYTYSLSITVEVVSISPTPQSWSGTVVNAYHNILDSNYQVVYSDAFTFYSTSDYCYFRAIISSRSNLQFTSSPYTFSLPGDSGFGSSTPWGSYNYLYLQVAMNVNIPVVVNFQATQQSDGSWLLTASNNNQIQVYTSLQEMIVALSLQLPLSIASNIASTIDVVIRDDNGYANIKNATLTIYNSIVLLWDRDAGFSKLLDPYGYAKLLSQECSVTILNSTSIKLTYAFALSGMIDAQVLPVSVTAFFSDFGFALTCSGQVSFNRMKPTLQSPADGSGPYQIGQAIQFEWSVPSGGTQTAFRIQVDDSPIFASPLIDTGKIEGESTRYSLSISKAGTWYWRVAVWDQYDLETGWSEARRVLVGYPVTLYGPFWDNGTRAAEQSVQVSIYFGPEYETLTFTMTNDTQVLTDAEPQIIIYRHASGVARILYPVGDENTFFIAVPDPANAAAYTIRVIDYTGRLAQSPFMQVCAYIEETGGFEPIICVPAQGQTQVILEYSRLYIIRIVKPGYWCYDHPVVASESNEIQVPIRLQITEETLKLYKYVAVEAVRNGSYIIVSYLDNVETNSPAVITIINVETGGVVWSEQRTGAVWQVIYPFASPESGYKVSVCVDHIKLGKLTFNRYLPAVPQPTGLFEGLSALGKIELPGGAEFPISQLIPVFAVLVCAALFSTKNAHLGALITVLFAGLLYLIGWLDIEPTLITICLGLAIMYLLSKFREER